MSDSRSIRSCRDLNVWQLGMDLSERVYEMTASFPDNERYGITSQLRRAMTSVPANIAEGHARSSTKDYLRHLSIAAGSLAEVETFIELSARLGLAQINDVEQLLESITEERRMLRGLQRALRNKLDTP